MPCKAAACMHPPWWILTPNLCGGGQALYHCAKKKLGHRWRCVRQRWPAGSNICLLSKIKKTWLNCMRAFFDKLFQRLSNFGHMGNWNQLVIHYFTSVDSPTVELTQRWCNAAAVVGVSGWGDIHRYKTILKRGISVLVTVHECMQNVPKLWAIPLHIIRAWIIFNLPTDFCEIIYFNGRSTNSHC